MTELSEQRTQLAAAALTLSELRIMAFAPPFPFHMYLHLVLMGASSHRCYHLHVTEEEMGTPSD